MTRTQFEFRRLYELPFQEGNSSMGLLDRQGRTRAVVLALAAPADWALLSRVWRGVQGDLGLPAPAIAVSGTDSLELWFSLADPELVAQCQGFLVALKERYLLEVTPQRLSLMPAVNAFGVLVHAAPLPALQSVADTWSAFVASDLAPVFGDTPWLDIPPSDEGQAQLLRGLRSITATEWRDALAALPSTGLLHSTPAPILSAACAAAQTGPGAPPTVAAGQTPQQFLMAVMNDSAAPLALRVEAAKALLPYGDAAPA